MHDLYSALSALKNLEEPSFSILQRPHNANILQRKFVEYDSYSLISEEMLKHIEAIHTMHG